MKTKVNYSVKRVCKICEKEFVSHSSNGKYCSEECKRKGDRDNTMRAYYKEKEKIVMMMKSARNPALSKLAKEARECGMSYGQYVGVYKL